MAMGGDGVRWVGYGGGGGWAMYMGGGPAKGMWGTSIRKCDGERLNGVNR